MFCYKTTRGDCLIVSQSNRTISIIEEMEKQGVIGPANHVGKRQIMVQDLDEVG